jgi:hypothetical protein
MQITTILAMMLTERDRLSRAIEILGGEAKRRGRPPANAVAPELPTASSIRRFSAATRRKMAASQKKRWAAARKGA